MKNLLLTLVLFSQLAFAYELSEDWPVVEETETFVSKPDLLEEFLRPVTTERSWTEQERKCLAKNIWHEARNEPEEGQIAVAVVTLNRVFHEDFPKDVCSVVYQRTQVVRYQRMAKNMLRQATITVCQFSWTCQPVKPPRLEDPRWLATLNLVDQFIQGEFEHLKLKYQEVYNYHAWYVNPRWNLKFFTKTGQHLFYKRYK